MTRDGILTILLIWHKIATWFNMRRVLVLSFYLVALILDSIRAFYFSFYMFANDGFLHVHSYFALAFFSLTPVLWFSLIAGEKNGFHFLKTISLIKLFSMLSTIVFFLLKMKRDEMLLSQGVYKAVLFFLCVDLLMLLFSLFRGYKLCR